MTASLSPTWGPFSDVSDARTRLSRFVDQACAPSVGVVWAADDSIYTLRPPLADGNGFGDVVIFHWPRVPAPPKPAPSGFWANLKDFLNRAAETQYQASMAEAQGNMALGKAMGNVFDRMIHTHKDDGLGVVFDVLCIGLSIALIPTGIGLVTTVAGIAALGGVALLAMDGTAYSMELAGDDEGAEVVKKKTEVARIIATVATLPDLFKGGFEVVRALRDLSEALPAAERTAATAEKLAARTANANRADRYAQIAEKAHLRAQIRREQIAALLQRGVAPRGAGLGGGGLLVREEIENDKSLYHQVLSRLQIHSTSLKK